MSKVKLLQEAAKHIGSWLGKADAATLRAASARIGANVATRGVGTVVNSAKENPVTAALLLFEMGALGSEMLDQLASSDERVAEVVDVLNAQKSDKVEEDDGVFDMGKFRDEFDDISTGVGIMGSMNRLMALRRVCAMDESVLLAYVQTRELGGNLR